MNVHMLHFGQPLQRRKVKILASAAVSSKRKGKYKNVVELKTTHDMIVYLAYSNT